MKLKTIKSKCEFFLRDKFIPTQCYFCKWWYISFLLYSADKKLTGRRRKIFKTDNIQHSWGVYEVANIVSENAKENQSAHVTLVFHDYQQKSAQKGSNSVLHSSSFPKIIFINSTIFIIYIKLLLKVKQKTTKSKYLPTRCYSCMWW